MRQSEMPLCPACRTKKHVFPVPYSSTRFHCNDCHGTFEPDDEGGDYSDRNPAARLMREDNAREAKLRRLGRR